MSTPQFIIQHKYKIGDLVGKGGMSSVYKAVHTKNKKQYAVKILDRMAISSRIENVVRFQNEARLAADLTHPHIVKIKETGFEKNIYFIVMEYIEGMNILDYSRLHAGSLADKIALVTQITAALSFIHKSGIIHRDLKPSNIIVTADGEVKIIDFGLAQVKDFSSIRRKEEIVGTFSYMSPEQCGVLQYPVDERSDLYSLGVVMYQILTGERPFTGDTIETIIHQHIAQIPSFPSHLVREIPVILDKIIMKLLEKEPAARYQSAEGLTCDLERFLHGERDFIPGLEDSVTHLTYRTPLVGREDITEKIAQFVKDSSHQRGGVCLVRGDIGTGKTRVVAEYLNSIKTHNKTIITVENLFGSLPNAYGIFRDCLAKYITHFLEYSAEKQARISAALRDKMGNLGALVSIINPQVTRILGDEEVPVGLEDAEKEHRRFITVVADFFTALARQEQGFIFFIDNIQWADSASIEVLRALIPRLADSPFSMIVAYRDHEITGSEQTAGLLTDIYNEQIIFTEINCINLSHEEVAKFVSFVFHKRAAVLGEIINLVYEEAKGNPLHTIEIIKNLVEEKIVYQENNSWKIHRSRLSSIDFGNSISDIISNRIHTLSVKEQRILACASAIDVQFSLSLLIEIIRQVSFIKSNDEEIVAVLDRARELQIVNQLALERGMYIFSHLRIAMQLEEQLTREEALEVHLLVAGDIEKEYRGEEEKLLKLAFHYAKTDHYDSIIQYAFPAGIQLLHRYAHREALQCFVAVQEALENAQRKGSSLWYDAISYQGEIHLSIGENDRAVAIYKLLLSHANDKEVKIYCNKQICTAYFKKGDWKRCEQYGKEGLRLLGERLPLYKTGVIVSSIGEFVTHFLQNIFSFIMVRKKENKKAARAKEIIWYYNTLGWMYILSDITKFIRVTLRMKNIAERRIGPSRELAVSYSGFAGLAMAIPLFSVAEKFHHRALAIREELGDAWGIAQSYQLLGFCYEWEGKYEKSIQHFIRSSELFQKIGDLREYGMSCNGHTHDLYFLAEYEKALEKNNEYQSFSEKSHDHYGMSVTKIYRAQILSEMGDLEQAEFFIKEGYAESKKWGLDFVHCEAAIVYGRIMGMIGKVEEGFNLLQEALETVERESFLKQYTVHVYPFLMELHFLKAERIEDNDERRRYLYRHKSLLKKMLKETAAWSSYRDIGLRMAARFYSHTSSRQRTITAFRKTIHANRITGRKYNLAGHYYAYAQFLLREQDMINARAKAETCYLISREIGADNIINAVREKFNLAYEDSTSAGSKIITKQRLSSIIKVSQDISSVLDLNDLLDHILEKALEVTGATNGYLFLLDEHTHSLSLKVTRSLHFTNKSYSKSIIDQVFTTGEVVFSVNASQDSRFSTHKSVVAHGIKSVIAAPIKHFEELQGVCYLDNPLSSGVFTEDDAEILKVIMAQAAIAIENARYYERMKILNQSFERFVPNDFLELLDKKNILSVNLGDHVQKNMTVLFSDIRSFTSLSEKMTPQENFNFINSYLNRMGPVIRNHNGIIDKYIGDAIMAIFPETPEHAVQCAIGVLHELKQYNREREEAGFEPIVVGIGIHTGTLILGTIGERERMETTVISDAVNVASRIEELTKHYQARILISEDVFKCLNNPTVYSYRFLDIVKVKGKDKQVSLFEILDGLQGKEYSVKNDTKEDFETGVRFYHQGKYKKALKVFKKLAVNSEDQAVSLYMERCREERMRARARKKYK